MSCRAEHLTIGCKVCFFVCFILIAIRHYQCILHFWIFGCTDKLFLFTPFSSFSSILYLFLLLLCVVFLLSWVHFAWSMYNRGKRFQCRSFFLLLYWDDDDDFTYMKRETPKRYAFHLLNPFAGSDFSSSLLSWSGTHKSRIELTHWDTINRTYIKMHIRWVLSACI